jgi:hypothetical protein
MTRAFSASSSGGDQHSKLDKVTRLTSRSRVSGLGPQAHSQYGFTFVLRDFKVDGFVRRSRVSRHVFESFQDRRRSRGKVEKDTSVSQIHLRRDVQSEQRIVRLDSGKLEEPMLRRDGYAARIRRQLTAESSAFNNSGSASMPFLSR